MALESLPVLVYTLALVTVIFSGLLFAVEPRDNLDSFPTAIFLIIMTMTTVGHTSEVIPKSPAGMAVLSLAAAVASFYMAIPLGIIGATFHQVWNDKHRIMVLQRMRHRLITWGYTVKDVP